MISLNMGRERGAWRREKAKLFDKKIYKKIVIEGLPLTSTCIGSTCITTPAWTPAFKCVINNSE